MLNARNTFLSALIKWKLIIKICTLLTSYSRVQRTESEGRWTHLQIVLSEVFETKSRIKFRKE